MSYASLLDHEVKVMRRTSTGSESDYGHDVTTDVEVATVRAAIQPKTAREVAMFAQAGVALSDHTIFTQLWPYPTTADYLLHVADECPHGHDLPDGQYELSGVRNAVGRGHHLELDARLIEPATVGAV